MKIGLIADIVGKPGRNIIKNNLINLREKFGIDFVIANGENASHGFGLTLKNCDELLECGVDCITGGNHTFDKKEDAIAVLKSRPALRPHNITDCEGSGVKIFEVGSESLAVVNLMGTFSMPQCENPFNYATQIVDELHLKNIKNIIIDFHAEATSEKAIMFLMQKGKVSAIVGSHTHVGTDDLQICDGTFFVSDIGLTGCFDAVIGIDAKNPIKKATTGLGKHFDIPKKCQAILQMIVVEIEDAKAVNGYKYKMFEDGRSAILELFNGNTK
mgnify:CR=1 FL=1